MVTCVLLCRVIGLRRAFADGLCLAAFLILCFNPMAVTTISFHLSFAAVLLLALIFFANGLVLQKQELSERTTDFTSVSRAAAQLSYALR